MDPLRSALTALLLAGLLTAPLAIAQDRDAPTVAPCDADSDGTVDPRERASCAERCDTDKDGRVSAAERDRCAAAARTRTGADRPTADCRRALEEAQQQRERLQLDVRARWGAFKAEQEARVREYGTRDHTEEEWAAFRAELAIQRERAEARVRNITEEMETRIGKLQACAGEGAASRYATCDAQAGDYARFKRMVERDAEEFMANVRARARAALENATTPEERAALEARVESAIASHRREMDTKWQELNTAHARSCLREVRGPREVRAIQQDVRADRLNCALEAEGVIDPFLDSAGRDATNWTQAQRNEFARLRAEAAAGRAGCERDVHDAWKAEVKERFEAAPRKDRLGSFAIDGDGAGSGTATGRYVTFAYERGSLILTDYAVQGLVLVERFTSPHDIQDPRAAGSLLSVRGVQESSFSMRIHDNPSGGLEGRCAAPGCTITLPEGATSLGETKANGTSHYRIVLGDAQAFLAVHGEHVWADDRTLDFTGAWRVVMPSENFVLDKVANTHRNNIRMAAERGNVLAEINVVADNGGLSSETIELVPMDDTGTTPDVGVSVTSAENGGIVVDLASNAPSGESVVINVDEATLGGNVTAGDLTVTYYEVADDGSITQVDLSTADDIDDALESDEATPEAIVVVGEDGVQVVVSNPHFSEKRIVISRTAPSGTTEGGSDTTAGGTTGGEPATTPTSPEGTTPATNGAPAPGVLVVAGIIGIAALALRRRRA